MHAVIIAFRRIEKWFAQTDLTSNAKSTNIPVSLDAVIIVFLKIEKWFAQTDPISNAKLTNIPVSLDAVIIVFRKIEKSFAQKDLMRPVPSSHPELTDAVINAESKEMISYAANGNIIVRFTGDMKWMKPGIKSGADIIEDDALSSSSMIITI